MYLVEADLLARFPSMGVYRDIPSGRYAVERDPAHNLVIGGGDVSWDDVHWMFLAHLLRHGDIFVGYFESLFFHHSQSRHNEWAFRLLRGLGIRIVVCAHGGDVVHRTPAVTRYDWVGREQLDYPDWDLREQAEVAGERIRLFCRFANLVLPGDDVMARFLPRRDLNFKYWPIDTSALRPATSTSPSTVCIVHAPNHRHTKGTDFLLSSLERLREAGFLFELRLVEKTPRHEALQIYSQADIIADQFCMGSFGLFAVEGLALAKPVLSYLDDESLGNPVFNLPVVNATPKNLTQVLAALIASSDLRSRLGIAGRSHVERYQSIPALSEVWARIYRNVWWDEPLELEHTRHFEAARPPRAFVDDPRDPTFWPVPVGDVIEDIRTSVRRVE